MTIICAVLACATGGCASITATSGVASAEAQIEKAGIVESAQVEYDIVQQSTHSETVIEANVELRAGSELHQPAEFAEYVAEVLWSVEGRKPEAGVFVSIHSQPQVRFGEELQDIGIHVTYAEGRPDSFALGFNRATALWGAWPVEAPEAFSG